MAAPNLITIARVDYNWNAMAIDTVGTLWCGLWSQVTTSGPPHMTWTKATQTWVTSSGSVNST